ncbi:MAG: outer membrane protein assembly factor BamC [Deltaproteobacteria bacterium]|nr:outer membrane protein assembly factor BamC [Deltaproteobacteria bacterium]
MPSHKSKRKIHREYDEVWKALEMIMVEELMYPIKVKDKNNGVIETDWVSIIRIRGTLRWNARVIVKRREGSTVVKVYNRIEEPSEVKGKMKDKKGDIKSGWQPSEEEVIGAGNILKILSEKLGEKPG